MFRIGYIIFLDPSSYITHNELEVIPACYRVLIVLGKLKGVVQALPDILGCVFKDMSWDFTEEKNDPQMKM